MPATKPATGAELFPRLFGQRCSFATKLSLAPDAALPEYKWINVANSGVYKGHWQGPFELTRGVFENFIRNLHAHPQYETGQLTLDGKEQTVGIKPVLQFDYEHASEMDPREGGIPQHGVPAPAWVCDLQIRDDSDGQPELWALGKLGTQIRGQIARDEYRFTSIAFDKNSEDWRTGEPTGPCLTSIAFTNQPFLRDLESYAAANRRTGHGPGDRLQPRATGNWPPASTQNPEGSDMNANAAADFEKFRTQICTALSVRTTLADQAVVDAVTQAASGGGDLESILSALGVKDAKTALAALPELMAARTKLSDVMGELDQLMQGQAAQQDAMGAGDVAAALSAKGWKPDLTNALLAQRSSMITSEESKVVLAKGGKATHKDRYDARETGRQAFLKEYGAAAGGTDTRHLTRTVAASAGGKQLRVNAPGGTDSIEIDPIQDDADAVDLTAFSGANPTEKVMRYLGSKDPSFDKQPHYQKCKAAADFQVKHKLLV